MLPLPVELVAGGEGKPEPFELTGLGGSGKSGISKGGGPRYIADEGRGLVAREGRGVIWVPAPGKKTTSVAFCWLAQLVMKKNSRAHRRPQRAAKKRNGRNSEQAVKKSRDERKT